MSFKLLRAGNNWNGIWGLGAQEFITEINFSRKSEGMVETIGASYPDTNKMVQEKLLDVCWLANGRSGDRKTWDVTVPDYQLYQSALHMDNEQRPNNVEALVY